MQNIIFSYDFRNRMLPKTVSETGGMRQFSYSVHRLITVNNSAFHEMHEWETESGCSQSWRYWQQEK